MKVLVAGHSYGLDYVNEKDADVQVLDFVHFEPNEEGTAFNLIKDGTTNEEVMKVLIDRITTLNKRLPCMENKIALYHLSTALDYLELRTLRRTVEKVEGTPQARAETGEEGSGNNL